LVSALPGLLWGADALAQPQATQVEVTGRNRWRQSGNKPSGNEKKGVFLMAQCEVCGNEYYLSFEVITAGNRHTFDSFECAIHKLAPVCNHCGCKIVGHGVEANNTFYCCANCARQAGVTAVRDHA
jgi:hypothetical protein